MFRTRSHRIYVRPTRFGVAFGVMIFIMFLASASYANNLVYLLTFLAFSVLLASMLATRLNLQDIAISDVQITDAHAGDEIAFDVILHAKSKDIRRSIAVTLDRSGLRPAVHSHPVSLGQNNQTHCSLSAEAKRRGHYKVAQIVIWSVYPLGLWKAWCRVPCNKDYVVFPRRSGNQELPSRTLAVEGDGSAEQGSEDFAEHRHFQTGDSYRHIDWKARARGMPYLIKKFDSGSAGLRLLDWRDVAAHDDETKLEQLTVWVDQCNQLDEPYGLSLPRVSIAPDRGQGHYLKCQTALALYGGRSDAGH